MATVIGPDFYEEMTGNSLPQVLADLVSPDDPALGYIVGGVLKAMGEGFDIHDPEELRAVVNAARRRYDRAQAATPYDRMERLADLARVRDAREARSVVYYMRLGNRIKIGTTTKLELRRQQIQPEEVLATEPGGVTVEQERHRQFAHLRVSGEWFIDGRILREHIARLREVSDGGRAAG